jgi:hypothetical protein
LKTQLQDFPLQIHVSFKKLFDRYREHAAASNSFLSNRAEMLLAIEKEHPALSKGLNSEAEVIQYMPQIDIVMEDLFSSILEKNEIKIATIPYNDYIIKSTERYKNIVKVAGSNFKPELNHFTDDEFYVLGCVIIVNFMYGFDIDFRRPLYYDIPDINGIERTYRLIYNADFVNVIKTDKAPKFDKNDFEELLDNFDNIAIWKEKFPPDSYIFDGFLIANLFDVTADVNISKFKANLLHSDSQKDTQNNSLDEEFEIIFRSLFNCTDLKLGFSEFNDRDNVLEKVAYNNISSFILNGAESIESILALCKVSYRVLFKQNEFYTVSNASKYHKLYPDNVLYKKLVDQGIESIILAPIVDQGNVIGIMELVSQTPNKLNSVNATKLRDIMPYLETYIIQSKQRKEGELELIIQEECTSIHASVHWKFKKEARRYLQAQVQGKSPSFREAIFENVYPLFGQIDIKGSSGARNLAVKDDLELQLAFVLKIIKKVFAIEELPIYEQIEFRINDFLKGLDVNFQVDSERSVLKFLKSEINPLFAHLSQKSDALKELIDMYNKKLDIASGFVYKHRKDYDESVMEINKCMASILDKKQKVAQKMYPHYFERFKTDGVEHNMYIGEAITRKDSFHKVYLFNLRLWQLQVMCEMENSYYKLKEKLALPLDVASMILVFNSPLSLRFRMDEKRFDVDGTYNARYEVIKKRVDKANIKGTNQRITQAGKITIIYSQKDDEKEYLKYINFLQHKKHLDQEIEILELQDLQGVTGLKAIRVRVLYARGKENKEYYTYEDLIDHINE